MAGIWYFNEATTAWDREPVSDDSRYLLVDMLPRRMKPRIAARKRLPRRGAGAPHRFLLVRTGTARSERWFAVLFAEAGLMVNGQAVPGGLINLHDRDLLRFPAVGREWVFTTTRSARIETFDGETGTFCPRCKLPLEAGQAIVVCPDCGTIHHQDEGSELPCWTYAAACGQCHRATGFDDAASGWTPDEL